MKKILVFGFTDTIGGVETFFMSYYRKFDKSKYQFDFVCAFENMVFVDEIEKNGGKVFYVSKFNRHPLKYQKEIKKIMSENDYDIVYANMLSAANIMHIKMAKKCGVKKIISHAHSSSVKNIMKKILHTINKKKIKKYSNCYLACSNNAGKWMFETNNYFVLTNSIDLEKFSFNEKTYNEEKEFLNGKKVIGHVGRFCYEKNQNFIIDFFEKLLKIDSNYYLYLIGNGETKESIRKKVKDLNLEKNICIVDGTEDVYKYYSKFDLFILPSKYEGLPIVGIEAQANGLPCLFSDTITTELKFNDNIEFLNINDSNVWVNEILKCQGRAQKNKLVNSSYDINYNYSKLEKILNEK